MAAKMNLGAVASIKASVKARPWWLWLLAINLIFVVATIVHHKLVLSDSIHFYLRQIDLAIEMNLAAWWSGILLLGLALLSYEIFSSRGERSRWAWLLLAIAFAGLSIDEIGSLHERVEDWLLDSPWPTVDPYVPIACLGLLVLSYPMVELFRHSRTRKTAWLLLAGFLLLTSIALQERLEGYVNWGDWWSLRLGLEEGTELLGCSVCYAALVNHTWRGNSPKGLSGVLPNPRQMKAVPAVALSGLVVHLAASAIAILQHEKSFSEHTLVWYPLALAAFLSLSAFWRYLRLDRRMRWLSLAIYLGLYSAVVPYIVPLTTDKADAYLSDYLYRFYILQLLVVVVLFAITRRSLKVFASAPYLKLFMLILVVIWSAAGPYSMPVRYGLPGLFTFLLFQLFFSNSFNHVERA